MAEQTNLRQGNAKIYVEGIVSEKDLKTVTEDNVTRIEGSITVKTSEVNFVTLNVRVNEKTKAGAENKTYAGIQTVMNEYKTIAEHGEAEADRIRVTADINPYRNKNSGEEIIGYKSNFFNRLKSTDEFDPKSEFSIEMFISSIIPEIENGDETGRIVVNGWLPTYNGIEPIKLVAEEDLAADIESAFEPGQTVEFYGEAVNNRITKTTTIPVAIGKPRTQTKTIYKNDLVITGASMPYEEGVSLEKPYEADTIKAAIQVREDKIKEDQEKAKNGVGKTTQKPSGAAHGRTLGF